MNNNKICLGWRPDKPELLLPGGSGHCHRARQGCARHLRFQRGCPRGKHDILKRRRSIMKVSQLFCERPQRGFTLFYCIACISIGLEH